MRTLILGASGLIGSHLAAACTTRDLEWLGTSLRNSNHIGVDIRNTDAVTEIVQDYKPDVTFLAAGLPSSDYAEAFPDECDAVVTRGTRNVAEAVAATGGRLVSFHTDELFHTARTARVEDATPAPGNAFARAHLAAENCIRELLPTRHLIARTSWVFGPESRRCPANAILRRLRRQDECLADANLHGHPTYAPDLAEVALQLAQVGETGTLHLAGPDRQTKFTFARLVAQVFGHDAGMVEISAEVGTVRPANVWLDRRKLKSLVGANAVRTTADGLRAMRALQRVAVAA